MKKKYTLENKAELTLQIKMIIGRIKKNPKELEFESKDMNDLINACYEYKKMDNILWRNNLNKLTREQIEEIMKMI